ncbi:sodium/hydrogen exchanger 6 [Tanacetum coccineum]
MDRRALWSNLVGHAGLMRNRPWVLMGDFNAALNLEDHSSSGYEPNVAMRDFKECVQAMEVSDVNCTGIYFTSNQKPKGSNGILKKIDRIIGNLQFNDDFPGSFAIFQPYRISDHSLCVLRIPTVSKPKPKPFKFANFLVYKEGFCEVVESGQNVNIEGFVMYRVVKRLKGLKSLFTIDKDPSSSILREEHAHYLLTFKEAQLDEEQFLKQKAKVEWFKAGDSKTAYFYRIVKSKCARNRIDMVNDSSNTLYDGNQVLGAFVNHYGQFLGTEGATNHLDDHDLYTHVLDTTKANFMVRDVIDIEFKNVIFSMGDDKAKGPDGFTAAFFKKAWDVVIGDITSVIRDFFLQCKLIANRIKEGLGNIVGINQSTFIPGRRISNNWKFLETILVGFGFHPKMVQWIMVCVSGASYSICVNGNLHGWFKGKRGLRQGDPLSPYLFTLVMEVLTLTLKSMVRNSNEFHYHHHCEKQRIINLCFADDLFLFARGHPNSVSVIIDALEEFKQVSGLVPSILKSTTFFCNVPNAIKASIMNSMPFAEGEMKKGKAKVVWDSVCMPKHEGGLDVCSLKDMLSNRDIARSGFSLDDLVSNLISDGAWRWPPDWLSRDDDLQSFSMACVWDTIRSWEDMVQWYNVVWFPHCILHHAIHMWLVVQQKLKTQDRLQQWDVHVLCGMDSISPQLADVIAFIIPISKGKTVISILSRIVVATTSYYIWLERNGRLFKKKTSSPDQIVQEEDFISGSNCSSYSNGAVEAGHFQV